MKALLIYSRLSGTSRIVFFLNYIKKTLGKKFSILDIVESKSFEDLKKYCYLASEQYDYLIFSGGDGSVNSVINILADVKKKPILAYIPSGTTNDFARNFHLSRNIIRSVKKIVKGVPVHFDVVKVNDKYAGYVLACGAFSEISYTTKRDIKKRVGPLAYYLIAMKDVFIKQRVIGTLIANGKTYNVDTPFLLILNGNHVGGFYVNFHNKINDGKFHIFITKQGVFNGLLHYLFFKVRTEKIVTDHFSFKFISESTPWCLDGEFADFKDVEVTCIPSMYQIIVSRKVAKKLERNMRK